MDILKYEINRVRDLLNELLSRNGCKTATKDVIQLSQKLDKLLVQYFKSCSDI